MLRGLISVSMLGLLAFLKTETETVLVHSERFFLGELGLWVEIYADREVEGTDVGGVEKRVGLR